MLVTGGTAKEAEGWRGVADWSGESAYLMAEQPPSILPMVIEGTKCLSGCTTVKKVKQNAPRGWYRARPFACSCGTVSKFHSAGVLVRQESQYRSTLVSDSTAYFQRLPCTPKKAS